MERYVSIIKDEYEYKFKREITETEAIMFAKWEAEESYPEYDFDEDSFNFEEDSGF